MLKKPKLQERTRFRSALDKRTYMHDMVNQYLNDPDVHTGTGPNRKCMDFIREINGILEKASLLQAKFKIIVRCLALVDTPHTGIYEVTTVQKSISNQVKLLYILKDRLKKSPVKRPYIEPIETDLVYITERLDYLETHILPEHACLTPWPAYEKLHPETDCAAIIEECFRTDHDNLDSRLEEMCRKMLEECADDVQWQENARKKNEFLEKQKSAIKESREKDAFENRRKRSQEALIALQRKRDELHRLNQQNFTEDDVRNLGLGKKIIEMHQKGCYQTKIVLLANTHFGRNCKPTYLCLESPGYVTEAIKKASIIPEHEPLPAEIQQKIEDARMVAVEMMME